MEQIASESKFVQRPTYLARLLKWRDKALVKVVTGVRRCGKSVLLEMFRAKLRKHGVEAKQFVVLNFEDPDTPEYTNWKSVWEGIKPRLCSDAMTYVFLDEVQRVPEFEKLVDGLCTKKNVDVYITGSNAYLLSGELATYLSGRYVEIQMQPLSFREYVDGVGAKGDFARHYLNYLRQGSFPYALSLDGDIKMTSEYLDGIYNTVLVKDVMQRKRLSDVGLVDRLARFLFDNIGNVTSMRNVAACLGNAGAKTNANTVEGYVEALCDSFLFWKAQRYDIRGKAILQGGCKYYAADMGLRYRLLGNRVGDSGRMLENVVYLELLRRAPTVLVGSQGGREVDFVTRDGSSVHYYQVAETVRDEATRSREYAALEAIADHHPKTLITLDEELPATNNGISQINAYDFLLGSAEDAKISRMV